MHLQGSLAGFEIKDFRLNFLNSGVVKLDDTFEFGDLGFDVLDLELNDSLLTISSGLLELLFKSSQGSIRVIKFILLGLKLHLVNLKDHLLSLDSLVEGRFELLQLFLGRGDSQSLLEAIVLDGNDIFLISFFLDLLFLGGNDDISDNDLLIDVLLIGLGFLKRLTGVGQVSS